MVESEGGVMTSSDVLLSTLPASLERSSLHMYVELLT